MNVTKENVDVVVDGLSTQGRAIVTDALNKGWVVGVYNGKDGQASTNVTPLAHSNVAPLAHVQEKGVEITNPSSLLPHA